eukprot:scaffold50056_cov67-Phaeocystis_antarctica.AAC.2
MTRAAAEHLRRVLARRQQQPYGLRRARTRGVGAVQRRRDTAEDLGRHDLDLCARQAAHLHCEVHLVEVEGLTAQLEPRATCRRPTGGRYRVEPYLLVAVPQA